MADVVSPKLALRGLTKSYGGAQPVVGAVDLEVADGECLALVGPSGCGKTTLLRLIAGLEQSSSGEIWIDGRRVDSLPPHQRAVSLAFQQPALFPHWSVRQSVECGLAAMGDVDRAWLDEVIQSMGVKGLLERMPQALSGGEQQRVALAGVLARRAAVVLLDEPMSSLDAALREALRQDLQRLLRRSGSTSICVTHDLAEAMAMGDRIAVLDEGRLLQVARPGDVYRRPASQAVARLWGAEGINLVPGAWQTTGSCGRFVAAGWSVELPNARAGSTVVLGVRPQALRLTDALGERPAEAGDWVSLKPTAGLAQVSRVRFQGDRTLVEVELGGRLMVQLPTECPWRASQAVVVWLDREQVHWFGENGVRQNQEE